ncbi:hypothetical protein [Nostoc sp. TCL26-01]|uniref:hypothetical protein n=1 Tax=Nostoc sp. TCL26-01 TaxID=2576904 RepID=UPI0015B867BC|nr:hypothetical protein [Nostoc sp. TCL26-01]QLE58537.1 hypothetical protein FD725_25345 [Nostoc sp. TCL26-01]
MATKSLTQSLKIVGIAASVSLASLAVIPKADASTLLFSDTAAFTDEITDLDPTDPTLTLTLDKYLPTADITVDKVVVSLLSAKLTTSGSITNTSRNTRTFTVETKLNDFTIKPNAGDPAVLTAFNPFGVHSGSPLTLVSQTFTLARNATANFGPFTNEHNPTPQTFLSSSDIAQFLAVSPGETFSFSPFTDIDTLVTSLGGNNSNNIATLAGVEIKVEYFGTRRRVPEASTTFGVLALAGILAVSRKAKSWQNFAG